LINGIIKASSLEQIATNPSVTALGFDVVTEVSGLPVGPALPVEGHIPADFGFPSVKKCALTGPSSS